MSTIFWKDVWIGETRLSDRFPRLFALESLKDCSVADRCNLNFGPFTRNWAWRRNVRSGPEQSQLINLLDLLKDFSPVPSPDSWTYCVDTTKSFSVSSMRKHIDASLLPSQRSQIRWNKTIPIKVNIFSWRLCVDRLPTRCNLDKRGLDLDSIRCPMCNDDLETAQHVFVECSVAAYLWNMISVWWGFNNFPSTLANLISWSDTTTLSPAMKTCFDAVVQTTFWVIWRYRNRVCFDLKPPRKDTLSDEIKVLSHSWIIHRINTPVPGWLDWIVNPYSLVA